MSFSAVVKSASTSLGWWKIARRTSWDGKILENEWAWFSEHAVPLTFSCPYLLLVDRTWWFPGLKRDGLSQHSFLSHTAPDWICVWGVRAPHTWPRGPRTRGTRRTMGLPVRARMLSAIKKVSSWGKLKKPKASWKVQDSCVDMECLSFLHIPVEAQGK